MKKTLLFGMASFMMSLSLSAQTYPQCDPANRPTGPDFPTHPDSMWIHPDIFPQAEMGQPYYEVIYIKFPETITTEFSGTVLELTFDSAVVTSVTGMPSGFSKKSNKFPGNDTWVGGEYGCVAIYGVSNVAGSYVPLINTTVYVTLPPPISVQQSVDTVFNNFLLVVTDTVDYPPLGISEVKVNIANAAYPNPANDKFFVNFNTKSTASVSFTITNLLGEVVAANTMSVVAGNNKLEMNTSDLAEGVYVYSVLQDGKRSSGKLTVTH